MQIDRIRLIQEMAKKRITGNELAEKSDLSRITISAIKNGKSCSQETAAKIAQALEVPLEQLSH